MAYEIVVRQPKSGIDEFALSRSLKENDLDRSDMDLDEFVIAEWKRGPFLGCARLRDRGDCLELASVVVTPRCRGMGIGGTMVRTLLGRAGDRPVYLMCEPREVSFFRRFGFEIRLACPESMRQKLYEYTEKIGVIHVMCREKDKLTGALAHPWPEDKQGGHMLAIRRNEDGSIDEVVGDADRIHLEQMGDAEWNLIIDHGRMQTIFSIIGKSNEKKVIVCRGRC